MRQKELRIALVCYGGGSLALYTHCLTKELCELLPASRDPLGGRAPCRPSPPPAVSMPPPLPTHTKSRVQSQRKGVKVVLILGHRFPGQCTRIPVVHAERDHAMGQGFITTLAKRFVFRGVFTCRNG